MAIATGRRGRVTAIGKQTLSKLSSFTPRAWFATNWQIEISYGRLALWLAPAMGSGVLLHLALPADVPAMLLYPLIALCLAIAAALRHVDGWVFLGCVVAAIALGMASADVAIRLAKAPRIESVITKAEVTGIVRRVEGRAEKAPRILIEVTSISGLSPPPLRLIAVGRSFETVKVGQAIAFNARLAPLPLPTHPGAYMPGFAGFFERIGGYAFIYGKPRMMELPAPSAMLNLALAIEAWRSRITQAIIERLGPNTGPVAAALVTGQRTAIPDDINREFSASGLLHVLSISGLHMALVAGGAFWLIRALLAAVPPIALALPVKKVAAIVAMLVASFYEIASGAEVATTRSYIMILVVFFAVLLDRPAITMRNLALSALVLLVIQPSSIVSPSFQMSFAATATLVAAYEHKLLPRLATLEQPPGLRFAARIAEAILATALISILIEIALLPITLHHFHRIAWFGVVGNVLAMTVVDILVMPAAVLVLVFVNFSEAGWAISLLGFAVERMLDIARFVASFPRAVSVVQGFGTTAMLLSVFGVMWACFWRSRIAVFGLVFYLSGVGLWFTETRPDVYVSASGRLIAARDGQGLLQADGGKVDRFALSRWLEAEGDDRKSDSLSLNDGRSCDPLGCTLRFGQNKILAIAKRLEAVEEDCARADILLIPEGATPKQCPFPRLILDQAAIRSAAGLTIYWRHGAPQIVSTSSSCGARPWCPSRDLRSREVWYRPPQT